MPRRRLLLHHHQTAYEPETLELPEEVVIPKKNAPSVNGTLRQTALRVPEVTWQCSGIMVFGKKIRSLVFSTDLAIIKNINADAVIAVYPFTPQPIINEALLMASDIPVFTGVGGGLTKGHRVVNLAMYAEMQGAMGVVVNVPTSGLVISRMRRTIDIPIVVTVANHGTDYARRIDDGAAIFMRSVRTAVPPLRLCLGCITSTQKSSSPRRGASGCGLACRGRPRSFRAAGGPSRPRCACRRNNRSSRPSASDPRARRPRRAPE